MGNWRQFVLAKAPAAKLAGFPLRRDLQQKGWSLVEQWQQVPALEFEDRLLSINKTLVTAVLAISIIDSDDALVSVCSPSQSLARVWVGEPDSTYHPGVPTQDFEELAAWSTRFAPHAISSNEVQDLALTRSGNADAAINRLLVSLGFEKLQPRVSPRGLVWRAARAKPPPDLGLQECEELHASTFVVAGRMVHAGAETPFIGGHGPGFIGIWNLDRGGPPIERFPDTLEGSEEQVLRLSQLVGESGADVDAR